jgi:hypothetical protein
VTHIHYTSIDTFIITACSETYNTKKNRDIEQHIFDFTYSILVIIPSWNKSLIVTTYSLFLTEEAFLRAHFLYMDL